MNLTCFTGALAALMLLAPLHAAAVFETDFSKAEVGKVPEEFLVLDGQFAVQETNSNRYLELPGAPLETFGVLFGPSQEQGLAIRARIQGTSQGRRFPAFAVSLGGVSGFRLQVSPGKKALEILKGDVIVATAPFGWKSGQWTWLRLQLRAAGDAVWVAQGRAWLEGDAEPADWMVKAEVKEKPVPGKSGVWGQPFAGTPIRFDDIRVEPAT
jgi:hypothetical protein